MAQARCLLMRRCGLRVSDVAGVKRRHMDGEPPSWRVEPGQGRTDRVVSLAAEAVAARKAGLALRPNAGPSDVCCWHQQRKNRARSTQGMQQQGARDATTAGINASGHRLRHTCASNVWADGAEVGSSQERRGHASITSSARDATLSHPRVTQVSRHTIRTVIANTRV